MPNSSARLLIVDDEPSVRTSLSQGLAEVGFSTRAAEDGFSALREIRLQVPDILLSDLNMPGMSGFELLSVVRRRFPAMHTIAMSGAFSGNEVPSGVAADAFYQKGSSMGALLQILGNLHHAERRAASRTESTDPIWIERNGHETLEDACLTIVCPECLRTFPLSPGNLIRQIHDTICIFCGSSIRYAIVEPLDRLPPQSLGRATGNTREMPESGPQFNY
jgi:CheY-like chemotaxis protein